MAKKTVVLNPFEAQQEEMTVVVFKFKGGSESMQRGFDAVNGAIAALGPAAQPSNQRMVIHRANAQLAPLATQTGDVQNSEVEASDVETQSSDDVTVAPAPNAPAAKPRKAYTFMSDFDLAPAGVPSWKEHAAQRSPRTDNDKFMVAAAWIQTHGGADPFTGRHLFTVFRAMDWKTQADMTQPMRVLKSKKSYFENPSSGKWRLTGIGLDAANVIGK